MPLTGVLLYMTLSLSHFLITTLMFGTVDTRIIPRLHYYDYFLWRNNPTRASVALLFRFLDHTHKDTHTPVRTPPNGWSSPRRGRYLTAHNKHKRQTFIPAEGFELPTPASKRLQTFILDRTAGAFGYYYYYYYYLAPCPNSCLATFYKLANCLTSFLWILKFLRITCIFQFLLFFFSGQSVKCGVRGFIICHIVL